MNNKPEFSNERKNNNRDDYKKNSQNKSHYREDNRPQRTNRTDRDERFKNDAEKRPERNTDEKRPYRDSKPKWEKKPYKQSNRENYKKSDRNFDSNQRNSTSENANERPFRKRTSEDNNRSDRPYRKRYDDNNKSERPYHKRDNNNDRRNSRPYRHENKEENNTERPYRKRYDDNNSPEKPYRKREENKDETKKYPKFRRDRKREKEQPFQPQTESDPETLRLNKYLAAGGVCSRREADEYIQNGYVKVNGEVVKEMGVIVKRTDLVEFKGRKIAPETKVYVLLNKPKNTITTVEDPEGRNTVMDLIEGCCKERLYPVGRLDRNTTGILLLTNDGDLAKKLTHPSSQIKKIYYATLDKQVTQEDIVQMAEGVELEDGFIAPDSINYADNDKKEIGIEIHSGKNRIIRRLFEHFGYTVEKLDRVYFAGLSKKDLPRGKHRFLDQREIGFLKML